jgi:hypothetical protein
MSHLKSTLVLAIIAVAACPHLAHPGSLQPEDEPAPTMRTLEELSAAVDLLERQTADLPDLLKLLAQDRGLDAAPYVITVVDPPPLTGFHTSLAFGPDGQPAISFQTTLQDMPESLEIARYDGADWHLTKVDHDGRNGWYSSLAFGPDGQPAIAYQHRGAESHNLRFARYDGNDWQIEDVDNEVNCGFWISFAFGPDGQPAIAHIATEAFLGNGHLKFARYDGNQWHNTNISGGPGTAGSSSLAFNPAGNPVIAYQTANLRLALAEYDGQQWNLSTLDSLGDNYNRTSLAYSPYGQPALIHKVRTMVGATASAYHLHFAQFDGQDWQSTQVLPSTTGDVFVSLAFGPDGHPAFTARTSSLTLARFNGEQWILSYPDTSPFSGRYSSLAFGPNGQPAISYQGIPTVDLRLTRSIPLGP